MVVEIAPFIKELITKSSLEGLKNARAIIGDDGSVVLNKIAALIDEQIVLKQNKNHLHYLGGDVR